MPRNSDILRCAATTVVAGISPHGTAGCPGRGHYSSAAQMERGTRRGVWSIVAARLRPLANHRWRIHAPPTPRAHASGHRFGRRAVFEAGRQKPCGLAGPRALLSFLRECHALHPHRSCPLQSAGETAAGHADSADRRDAVAGKSRERHHGSGYALWKLEALDPRKSKVLELRIYLGATAAEAGQIMGLSKATVDRDLDRKSTRLN